MRRLAGGSRPQRQPLSAPRRGAGSLLRERAGAPFVRQRRQAQRRPRGLLSLAAGDVLRGYPLGARALMRGAADRLSVRWFLGYDLHEPLPDHSSLTRIRERYGLESFRRFFERIVEECFEAGLVRGKELFFDATKVEANAAVDSLAPRWAVEAHLEGLFEAEEAHLQQEEGEDVPKKGHEITELPTACDDGLRERNAAKSDWISRAGRQDRSFESGYRPRTSDSRASKTDPDATSMTWARSGRADSATRSTTSWTGVRSGS